MINLSLHLEPDRQALYAAALARLPDVEVVSQDADAMITNEANHITRPALLDQPEALSSEDLEALDKLRIMPAHQWRFSPSILPVQESRANGQLGEPGLLRTHHWLSSNVPPTSASFAQVDLAHWFFGSAPNRIHTLSRVNYLQLHLGFPANGMALIDTATNRPGNDDYYSLHLIGSSGAAYADDHRNAHLLLAEQGSQALMHQQDEVLAIQNMLSEFVAGLRENRDWKVSLEDTLNALATVKEATTDV